MGIVKRSSYREPMTPEGIRGIEEGTIERFDDSMFANLNTGVLEQYLEERNRTESFELSRFDLKKVLLMIVLVGLPFTLVTQYATVKTGVMLSGAFYISYLLGLGLRWSPTEINIGAGAATAAEKTVAGFVFTFPAVYFLADRGVVGFGGLVENGSFSSPAMIVMLVACSAVSSFLGLMYMVVLRRLWIVKDPLPSPGFQATVKLLQISNSMQSGQNYGLKGTLKRITFSILAMVLLGSFQSLGLIKVNGVKVPVFDYLLSRMGFGDWVTFGLISTPPGSSTFSRPSFSISGLLFAVGWFLRRKGAAIILLGSILTWFIMIPLAVFMGLPVEVQAMGEVETYKVGLNHLDHEILTDLNPRNYSTVAELAFEKITNPVSIGVILGAGLTAILKIIPGLLSFWKGSSGNGLPGEGPNRKERYEWSTRFLFPTMIAAFLTILLTFPLFGGFDPVKTLVLGLILVPITLFLSAVSVKIIGEIGLSPTSPISILLVFILFIVLNFILSPSDEERGTLMLMVLLSTTIFICTMSLSSDVIWDFKAGHYAGSRPYHLVKGQTIGIVLGLPLAGLFAFLLSGQVIESGMAPQAGMVTDTAVWMLERNIPWNLILLGLFTGIVVESLTGMGTAFAIGMFLHFHIPLGLFIGAMGRELWERRWLRRRAGRFGWSERDITMRTMDTYVIMIGLMIGESVFGAVLALFLYFGN